MNDQRPARTRALATQSEGIARNVAQIEEAKQRPTAIQAMAVRLNMSPGKLQETLRQTVFRDANDAEFAALIVVSDQYRLNPLLKEIFAFKAKGGGIIPYVSVDGWIRIINEHPQFDGVEFEDILDEQGEICAIECTMWRKDRTRPIKITEYLDECVRDTDPWRKSPKRFLRHRSLMQAGRVAFGFSGIGPEDDYEIIPYAPQVDAAQARLPRRSEMAEGDMIDNETGEVLDGVEEDGPAAVTPTDRDHQRDDQRNRERDSHAENDAASLEADEAALRQMDRDRGGGVVEDDEQHEEAEPQPEVQEQRQEPEAAKPARTTTRRQTAHPAESKVAAIIQEVDGRLSSMAVDNVLKNHGDDIEAMPEDMQARIRKAATARKEWLANRG